MKFYYVFKNKDELRIYEWHELTLDETKDPQNMVGIFANAKDARFFVKMHAKKNGLYYDDLYYDDLGKFDNEKDNCFLDPVPVPVPVVHDFTTAGNYFISEIIDRGQGLRLGGWTWFGAHLKLNDYLILKNKEETTRYRIIEIKYMGNPNDQWFATVKFDPR